MNAAVYIRGEGWYVGGMMVGAVVGICNTCHILTAYQSPLLHRHHFLYSQPISVVVEVSPFLATNNTYTHTDEPPEGEVSELICGVLVHTPLKPPCPEASK
eukprot:TRINITY_DN3279_c0_g1_i8.p2 TRINITY_DN3279_c0_g1~~TRINITY_DN3279_c0_g1_i8.p2  ORF type:complete len:101 (-),score=0.73 TRINITY_DN3279_c0_g1_i8:231-533(-)